MGHEDPTCALFTLVGLVGPVGSNPRPSDHERLFQASQGFTAARSWVEGWARGLTHVTINPKQRDAHERQKDSDIRRYHAVRPNRTKGRKRVWDFEAVIGS